MAKKLVLVLATAAILVFFTGAKTTDLQKQETGDEVLPLSKDAPTSTQTQTATATLSPVPATATATPTSTPVKKPTVTAKKTPAGDEVNSFIERLKATQQKRKAIKMNITITTTYAEAGTSQVIKGDVTIKKKDKFMVKYTEPSEQLIVSNGVKLWVYTPALNQVIVQNMDEANLDTHFYIEIENSIDFFAKNSKNTLTEEGGFHVLKMKPFNKKAVQFDEITVKVEKEKLLPVYMSMKYEGQKVETAFSDIKTFTAEQAATEKALDNSVFNFKVPEGAEVIEGSELMQGMR